MEEGLGVLHLDGNHEVDQHEFFLQCMDFRPQMISYARRLMGPNFGGDIEDLVQDVLIKAVLHRHQFKPGTNLKSWLLTITHNSFMNHQRRARRTVLCDPSWEPENMNPDLETAPLRAGENLINLVVVGMRLKLETALNSGPIPIEEVDRSILTLIQIGFPPIFAAVYEKVRIEYRVPFALVDIMGFDYAEVATLLGMPMGTVMSRIYRGRNSFANNPRIIEMGGLYGLSRVEGRREYTK